jgi:hypothetical protein
LTTAVTAQRRAVPITQLATTAFLKEEDAMSFSTYWKALRGRSCCRQTTSPNRAYSATEERLESSDL